MPDKNEREKIDHAIAVASAMEKLSVAENMMGGLSQRHIAKHHPDWWLENAIKIRQMILQLKSEVEVVYDQM